MPTLTEPAAIRAGRHHVVQFYRTDEELVAGAGRYLSEGAAAGEVVILIATEAHGTAFEARLRSAGVDVAAARIDGTLVSLDAAATLARFMRDGRVDPEAFFDVIGGIVRAAAATGRSVRAYGEMVALLWEAGDVMSAIELETLWNELAKEIEFSLYCVYRSDSVAGHDHADALHEVCRLHSEVVPAPPIEATWNFPAEPAAAAAARKLVAAALDGRHDERVLDDAQFVIAELAANAILHVGSAFSISIRSENATLRILVRDRSRELPVLPEVSLDRTSGRGLRLVDALARRWGVDLLPDGKAVWAELGP